VVGAKLSNLFLDQLFYWRDGASEVDFVVNSPKNLFAIEVKLGRKKGIQGVSAFKKLFPKAHTLIVSEEVLDRILRLKTTSEGFLFLQDMSNS
jgi:predicted AAA+ superfamily ATPase